MNKYPLKLSPYVSETIWGGRKLIDEYNVKTDKSNAAEGWMLSCLEAGPSTVVNGEYAGLTLPEVLQINPGWAGKNSERFDNFPVLVKFIDAMDDLSVQVHPTDEYCRKNGKGHSKTECWYIIDCEPGASLMLGFRDKISREEFIKSIEDGILTEYTKKVPVKKGDFFFIEAGTLHAICKGVLLAEVQESSNTTYRIFDYNRTGKDGKPRELHVKDAVEVTKLEPYVNPYPPEKESDNCDLLVSCDLFSVRHIVCSDSFTFNSDDNSFVSLLIMDGEGTLRCGSHELTLKKGDSIFIPAGESKTEVTGKLDILETRTE